MARLADDVVRIDWQADRFAVTIGGAPFTDYRIDGELPRPICYPVLGAHGRPMTRRYPQEDAGPGEERDHVHHRSLWFTHGAVNGHDFWAEAAGHGRIAHESVRRLVSGQRVGVLHTRNRWLAADGATVCTDDRVLRFFTDGGARCLDFDVTVHASHGALAFGDTKEGTMAMRVHPALRLKGEVAAGHIVNSAGQRDGACWGRRAAWVDYSGPIDGEVVGVALLDHPGNPRHPTWWHARDYGLLAANPFGVSDFERGHERGEGDLAVPAGGAVRFRYRFVFHAGDAAQADVAARFARFAEDR